MQPGAGGLACWAWCWCIHRRRGLATLQNVKIAHSQVGYAQALADMNKRLAALRAVTAELCFRENHSRTLAPDRSAR